MTTYYGVTAEFTNDRSAEPPSILCDTFVEACEAIERILCLSGLATIEMVPNDEAEPNDDDLADWPAPRHMRAA